MDTLEKELAIVELASVDAMLKYDNAPFAINQDIIKVVKSGSHPFAYMDLDSQNQKRVLALLEKVNSDLLVQSKSLTESGIELRIPTENIYFTPPRENTGYTRLICTPLTPTGKDAKYPFSLLLCIGDTVCGDKKTCHGRLTFSKLGLIEKGSFSIGLPDFWIVLKVKRDKDKLIFERDAKYEWTNSK